jgi:hypothetical protein
MGGIVGIDVTKILHWFDYFKFNVPYWFYGKLVDVHINWLKLFKNVGQIDSISTKDLEDIKLKNNYNINNKDNTNTFSEDLKNNKFWGLDKTQWLIVLGVGVGLILICAGVYLTFYSSDSDDGGDAIRYNRYKDIKNGDTVISNLDDTPKQIRRALDNSSSNVGWKDYIKNKLIPGWFKSNSSIEEIIPTEDSKIHEIIIEDNTTKLETTSGLGLTDTQIPEQEKFRWKIIGKVRENSEEEVPRLSSRFRRERKGFLLSKLLFNYKNL